MNRHAFLPALLGATLLVGAACDRSPGASVREEGEPAASFSSEIQYRVVNALLDNGGNPVNVDVYVSDPDLSRGIPFVNGLGYGDMSDSFPAPADGGVVVVQEGTTDPLCQGNCPYTMAVAIVEEGQGDERLLIVRNGGSVELWAQPNAADAGKSLSALPLAVADQSLLLAVSVTGEYRLALDGQAGCQPAPQPVTVNATQVASFEVSGPNTRITVHGGDDTDCSADPVAAPVSLTPADGTRTLLMVLPQVGSSTRVKVLDLKL